jgi:hypothetical protein
MVYNVGLVVLMLICLTCLLQFQRGPWLEELLVLLLKQLYILLIR